GDRLTVRVEELRSRARLRHRREDVGLLVFVDQRIVEADRAYARRVHQRLRLHARCKHARDRQMTEGDRGDVDALQDAFLRGRQRTIAFEGHDEFADLAVDEPGDALTGALGGRRAFLGDAVIGERRLDDAGGAGEWRAATARRQENGNGHRERARRDGSTHWAI